MPPKVLDNRCHRVYHVVSQALPHGTGASAMTVTTRKPLAPTHYIYRHRKAGFPCKIIRRFTREQVLDTMRDDLMLRGFFLRVCECGKTQQGEGTKGKVKPEETCGSKCRSSKGPACECSCGGENHGANY